MTIFDHVDCEMGPTPKLPGRVVDLCPTTMYFVVVVTKATTQTLSVHADVQSSILPNCFLNWLLRWIIEVAPPPSLLHKFRKHPARGKISLVETELIFQEAVAAAPLCAQDRVAKVVSSFGRRSSRNKRESCWSYLANVALFNDSRELLLSNYFVLFPSDSLITYAWVFFCATSILFLRPKDFLKWELISLSRCVFE